MKAFLLFVSFLLHEAEGSSPLLRERKADADPPRSIVEFGATANDLTDDTDAIHRAIDATPAGGTLLFPAGEYRISSLHIRKNITCRGDGPNFILRQTAGIRKGTVLIATPREGETAIDVASSAQNTSLQHFSVYLSDASDAATLLAVSAPVEVKNVELASLLRSHGTGIVVRGAGQLSGHFDHVSTGFRLRFGLLLEGKGHLQVTHGQMTGWDTALLIRGEARVSFEKTRFSRVFDADAPVYPAPAAHPLTGLGNQPSHYLPLVTVEQGQAITFNGCLFEGGEPDEEQRPELPPGIITNAVSLAPGVRGVVFSGCSWENVFLRDEAIATRVTPGPGEH